MRTPGTPRIRGAASSDSGISSGDANPGPQQQQPGLQSGGGLQVRLVDCESKNQLLIHLCAARAGDASGRGGDGAAEPGVRA